MLEQPFLLISCSSLVIGLLTGYVMHRSDFCVTACFRDFFLFRDAFLLRQLLLLVVFSMALFEAGRLAGLIGNYPFPLLAPPSLSNLIGGFIFGIGMVLAGGCVCGSLYKLGAGSTASLLAVVGMLAGSTVYAEIHPQWSALAKATVLTQNITVAQWIGVSPTFLLLPLAIVGTLWLYREFRAGRMERPAYALGHLAPWKAALILAFLGFASYVLIGMPLGITTAYSKLGATIESFIAPQHVAGLAYFSLQPLDYIPPFAKQAVRGGPGPNSTRSPRFSIPCCSASSAVPFFSCAPRRMALALALAPPAVALGTCRRAVAGTGCPDDPVLQHLALVGRTAYPGLAKPALSGWPDARHMDWCTPLDALRDTLMPMTQTIDIDIRGQICPSCLLLTLRELNQNAAAIRSGSVEVQVLTDDRQATATIPSTADRMGFGTEVLREKAGYRIRIFGTG